MYTTFIHVVAMCMSKLIRNVCRRQYLSMKACESNTNTLSMYTKCSISFDVVWLHGITC